MPRFKIETSLFEPVTIEVEGGRTYESVPLSPLLIREVQKLEEQRKAKTLDGDVYVVQAVALIFGLKPEEVEIIDIRLLSQMLEHATTAIMGGKAGKVMPENFTSSTVAEQKIKDAVAEALDSKNGLKPEAVTLQ